MTPQQKALIAELRAADYPATWKLSARAVDDKLVASATQIPTSARVWPGVGRRSVRRSYGITGETLALPW